MQDQEIHQVVEILRQEIKRWRPALVDDMAIEDRDPYKILNATILSLRTKDTITERIVPKLFALADNPADMVKHSVQEIADIIYQVGFYRTKARNILTIAQILLDKYDGQVPDDLEKLLKLPGVGRKTANLVLTAGFNKQGICVDVHVHRISNRWGYVQTKDPDQTEFALRKKLPVDYWMEYNKLLVTYGQNLCTSVSPWCSKCKLTEFCDRISVGKSR
jgi:endonuclease-3